MGGETVNGTWLGVLWPISRKSASDDKEEIGILALEVAGLMSKVVNLWHSLGESEVMSLREWIVNSVGVKMLVSDDDYFLMELALNELLNNFESLARYVARLGKRCRDPVYHGYEHFVNNPCQNCLQWSGWEYRWKKMERKVKKMEKFVAAMSLLSQELDVLAEREQTFRRMQVNPECNRVKLLEFQKKVMWHRQQVKNLRDMSPWNRSYDYIVRLLARSLFTILERIILVFGNSHLAVEKQLNDSLPMNTNNHLSRTLSFPILMHYGFCSEPTGSRPVLNSGVVVDKSKSKKKEQQTLYRKQCSEIKQLKHFGSFKGCKLVGNDSHVIQSRVSTSGGSMRLIDSHMKNIDNMKTVDQSSLFYRSRIYFKLSLKGRLKPAPSTLGDAALALHYANVITLIERVVSAPHLIDLQTRDDLYNMLPTTIRTALRAKLKWYAKSKHDANLALEWSVVLTQILEWLAPLAHNMIKWYSERNFEREHTTLKANVLLVQTLYFANQAKTEAAMVELLVGLHYVCSIDREAGIRDTPEFAGFRSSHGVRLRKNELCNKFI
ncbi:protein PSK SIMULATOR 1-like [Gastrolobium bilobum]|uniref:protein PSK SIMULATOR 1-like n=1 Tax=Gastrolobium bilobum TaxID=150636 RepID=UPI002AB100B4|nr:protein PSK SIMULATOR 1-like [Gastrolobium bilobum]XP_061337710.1 protein PSK SIMULATOR 1-like [Gastrolobium bilobum]XP_061368729.1 protein PSK SIMULATOR 1-like [Gastrolobium bilobum]